MDTFQEFTKMIRQKYMDYNVESERCWGRRKKTWREVVENALDSTTKRGGSIVNEGN